MPVTTSTRPDWQTQDEHINASKDFQVMDVATARDPNVEVALNPACGGFGWTRTL